MAAAARPTVICSALENGKLHYVHTLTHLLQANFRGGGARGRANSQQ